MGRCAPSCKAPLEPDQDECPSAPGRSHAAVHLDVVSPMALCLPYQGQLALGFILMLLGTAAHQVPLSDGTTGGQGA